MMRKGQAVHCSGHLDVGEQYVDATGVAFQGNQCIFGVLNFHYLETCITERLDDKLIGPALHPRQRGQTFDPA